MPRITPAQPSFTTGEISPKAYGRFDVQRYLSALQSLVNYLVLPQGGVTRRPGTRYIATSKNVTDRVRLIRFEFNVDNAYVLEFGNGYLRFYKNTAPVLSGGTPYEVSTPYLVSDLAGIDVVQSGDVLYILHASYATRKLERYSDTLWKLRTVVFTPPPSLEYGSRPVVSMTPAATSGNGVAVTSSDCAFLIADIGREILVTSGANAGARAGIKDFDTFTRVLVNICEPFVNTTANPATSWKITASPKTALAISALTPVGAAVTLTLTTGGWRGAGGLGDSDCGRFVLAAGGSFEITGLRLGLACTVADALIRGEGCGATTVASGAWSLEEALWSTCNGFAETGTFQDDRFYLSAGYRFAGSKSGDYENFGLGVQDDDAVLFAINSDQINAIRALQGGKALRIFTAGGEFVAQGGNDSPITATSINVTDETTYGANGVRPLRVGNVVLFVSRSGRQLREFTVDPNAVVTNYVAPDLLLLAEHLTSRHAGTLTDLAYQRDPSLVWAVRSDGALLSCTYRREENIVAWARHFTCGAFESVAVIPHPDGDREQVWVSVRRTIGGQPRRYIEVLDDAGLTYDQLNTDAALTCSPGAVVTSVGGLSHLEGLTVAIVGDGAVYPQQTVSGGTVTLDPGASAIEIGLPYTSTLQTLRLEAPTGAGSSQPHKLRWVKPMIRVLETLGMSVGTAASPDVVPFRRVSDAMDAAPMLQSGYFEVSQLGWDACGTLTVLQTDPLPSTILTVTGLVEVGGA